MTSLGKLKIEVAIPNFFFLPTRKMETESVPETGRVYFIADGRIVAVAKRGEQDATNSH
jgi:hypothetical protein